jgi:hypothetical protein
MTWTNGVTDGVTDSVTDSVNDSVTVGVIVGVTVGVTVANGVAQCRFMGQKESVAERLTWLILFIRQNIQKEVFRSPSHILTNPIGLVRQVWNL